MESINPQVPSVALFVTVHLLTHLLFSIDFVFLILAIRNRFFSSFAESNLSTMVHGFISQIRSQRTCIDSKNRLSFFNNAKKKQNSYLICQ